MGVKESILVYNEHAPQQLREIKTRRAELRQEYKSRFARLDELQQISYTNAMARDVALVAEEDYDPELLESEYYKELYRINEKRDNVEAHKALENWVPLCGWRYSLFIFARSLKKKSLSNATFLLFSWMPVFTASAIAFSHGSNAVLDVMKTGEINDEAEVPVAVMMTKGIGLIAGLWFIGRYVSKTVSSSLTKIPLSCLLLAWSRLLRFWACRCHPRTS